MYKYNTAKCQNKLPGVGSNFAIDGEGELLMIWDIPYPLRKISYPM